MKRMRCRSFFALFLLVVSYATQIGGRTAAAGLTPKAGDGLQPLITTSEFVVGQNRFAFGLLKANKLLEGVSVTLRVYTIEGSEAHLAAEFKAPYQEVRYVQQARWVHRHADGTEHVHDDEFGIRGLYVAQVSFTRAGPWGIELLASEGNGPVHTVRFAVTVLDTPTTPAIGSAAPRSRNLIGSDVKNSVRSIAVPSRTHACIRCASPTPSNKASRSSSFLRRRNSAPAACVVRWSTLCGLCCQLMENV